MNKLTALLVASAFAFSSAGAFAMSHGGAAKGEMKTDDKMEMKADAKDPCKDLKDAAKAECEKKNEHKEMKTEEKAKK